MSKKVNLDVLSEEQVTRLRENTISRSMDSLKSKIREMDIQFESTDDPAHTEERFQNYTGHELAEVAVSVYKGNINPPVEDQEVEDQPMTHARRVEKQSLQRALMGLRNGGNEGKVSPVGPNGNGNLGKLSPTGSNGCGNEGTNTQSGNYYALTTDMTLEEYEAYIAGKFQMDEAGPLAAIPAIAGKAALVAGKGLMSAGKAAASAAGSAVKGTAKAAGSAVKGTAKAAGKGVKKAAQATADAAAPGSDSGTASDSSVPGPNINESRQEAVSELENELLQLEDTSWTSIDKVMRVLAKEHAMTPKELHKAFKAVHGVIPDDWLRENQMTEDCGFLPLHEVARINPPGIIYQVSFLFRGGTQRYKFLYPSMERPSQEDMEEEVRKFWPGAKVMAYYPCQPDNETNLNGKEMIACPPVTENYNFIPADVWIELSEEDSEIIEQILNEEGEMLTPPYFYDDGFISTVISDHDTGEEKQIVFEVNEGAVGHLRAFRTYQTIEEAGNLHAWFNKSKSKDGKPGWVQSDGSPCARKEGQTSAPKCYSSQRLAGLKKSEEGRKKIRSADARKKSQDSGQSSKSGAAKPTYVRTFKDSKDLKKHPSGDNYKDTKNEEVEHVDEACWKGYTKKGMKKMFGKMYPNCVKTEGALNPFQVHFDKDGKPYTSKGSKEEREKIAKNRAANRKNEPDPYRPRRGESD